MTRKRKNAMSSEEKTQKRQKYTSDYRKNKMSIVMDIDVVTELREYRDSNNLSSYSSAVKTCLEIEQSIRKRF